MKQKILKKTNKKERKIPTNKKYLIKKIYVWK